MSRGSIPEIWEYQEEERGEQLQAGVLGIRTKTIKSGDFLECEMFPIVIQDHARKEERKKKSLEKQQRANRKNAQKKLTRILNANFGLGDLLVHLTLAEDCKEDVFQRMAQNFIRRLKTRYRNADAILKYLYVIEGTGEGDRKRWHVHMALNGGVLSRDEVEQLWGHGLARVDRVQRQDRGLAGFANYITQRKETQVKLLKRKWACSKNLKNPEMSATTSDSKFSRKATWKIEEAARNGDMMTLRGIYAKKYPGYMLIDMPEVRYSEYLPGAYIYAWLRKTE